eukprot:13574130-Alexandrium_andersonii.AAC.1
MAAVNAKRQELRYFEGEDGRSRARKFGTTLRAKCAMHISEEANELAPFSSPSLRPSATWRTSRVG